MSTTTAIFKEPRRGFAGDPHDRLVVTPEHDPENKVIEDKAVFVHGHQPRA
jgi:hypothetical protein